MSLRLLGLGGSAPVTGKLSRATVPIRHLNSQGHKEFGASCGRLLVAVLFIDDGLPRLAHRPAVTITRDVTNLIAHDAFGAL